MLSSLFRSHFVRPVEVVNVVAAAGGSPFPYSFKKSILQSDLRLGVRASARGSEVAGLGTIPIAPFFFLFINLFLCIATSRVMGIFFFFDFF